MNTESFLNAEGLYFQQFLDNVSLCLRFCSNHFELFVKYRPVTLHTRTWKIFHAVVCRSRCVTISTSFPSQLNTRYCRYFASIHPKVLVLIKSFCIKYYSSYDGKIGSILKHCAVLTMVLVNRGVRHLHTFAAYIPLPTG
jgi:hypothetical protein